jgi:hypothetical protein
MRRHRPSALLAAATLVFAGAGLGATAPFAAAATTQRVLLVGSYHGIKGGYASVQAAVDAAKPHDWILVGPGDYHERGDYTTHPPQGGRGSAGVWIDVPHLTIRGMNRNTVVIDGTLPGAPRCSNKSADQTFGPLDSSKQHLGRNGVEIWKATDVSVENLTVCNFLNGAGDAGNQIWWNGGDDSGVIGGWGAFYGAYLTATTTFFGGESTAAQYGIFSSNWVGQGARAEWDHTYASNFNDSGYYIGACRQECGQVVNHAWAEYNVLGYSGSNSGGSLVIENSEFDNNTDGFDTNSQNGDNPPPQNGACPGGAKSPITHTTSCWVFMHNYVHDNNNANVPFAGLAGEGPVGTGMSLSGARNDTVMDNRFVHNGAWGVIDVPFPDSGPPCTGGTQTNTPAGCLYDDGGIAIEGNSFSNNGFFGNPTNGDIAESQLEPTSTSNCFGGNIDTTGTLTTSPVAAETVQPTCSGPPPAVYAANVPFIDEVACDSGASIGPANGTQACLPGATYPRHAKVVMHPLPAGLTSMPDPCAGVPANPWCSASGTRSVSSRSLATTGASLAIATTGLLLILSALGIRTARRRFG